VNSGHRQIEFRVDGDVPPKKDGANSMWAKRPEVSRLMLLRKAALEAMQGAGPFRKNISIKLEIHCPAERLAGVGDLDNFVSGVCDGLMAAGPRIGRDTRWMADELASINPELAIAIEDDSEVCSIMAMKETSHDGSMWYRVILEGER
jgi:hypothetical protein